MESVNKLDYKIVHGFHQALFRTQKLRNIINFEFVQFSVVSEQVSDVIFSEKNRIIYVIANQKSGMSSTQLDQEGLMMNSPNADNQVKCVHIIQLCYNPR